MIGRDRTSARLRRPHALAIVRDVVEVVAIVAAGVWAFYVFVYENRIKPSIAQPEIDVTASLQRLSERRGLIAAGLHLKFHNIGTVKAHFLGVAVNVYGQRVAFTASPRPVERSGGTYYGYDAYYRLEQDGTVYSFGYITHLGNPATRQDTELDPGTTIENYRTFYVPVGRFDLLSVGIDVPYTKYDERTLPAHLAVGPSGDVRVVTSLSPRINQYNILPVTSLDVR